MSEGQRVLFTGLREANRALAEMGPEARKAMNKALRDVAEHVAADARRRVPQVTGAAAKSYKPHGNQRGASISFGGPKAPYAPWLDFGGTLRPDGKRHNTQHRPTLDGGRYLYPAIFANLDEVGEMTLDAIEKVWGEHGRG